jgi:hypothetical protein
MAEERLCIGAMLVTCARHWQGPEREIYACNS